MKIRKITYGNRVVEYDADAPCIICGEQVIGASIGGTVICGHCDMGKCRYCGINVFALKEEIDGGESKRRILAHMKWHHEHNPELVLKINNGLKDMMDRLDRERELNTQKKGENQ